MGDDMAVDSCRNLKLTRRRRHVAGLFALLAGIFGVAGGSAQAPSVTKAQAPAAEREFMWTENNQRVDQSFYTKLKTSKSIAPDKDEYDVFGDGLAVIKSAPGHTPGHQVLILRLASLGRIMIAGDLYHYPPE